MDYFGLLKQARKVAPIVPHGYTTALCPALIVQYVPTLGTGGSTATAALVQSTTDTFTVLIDSAAPDGVDAFGTAGVISTAAAAYDTVGEFAAYVNGLPCYRAICNCRPETPMANLLAKTATSIMGAQGLVFYFDLSVADTTYINWGCPISGEAFVNNGKNGHWKDYDFSKGAAICENRFHYAQINCNFTTSGTFYLYSFKQNDATSTLLYTKSLTDATLTDVGNVSNPTQPFIVARPGHTLVAEVRTAGGSDTMGSVIVAGSTAVLDGSHIIEHAAHLTA